MRVVFTTALAINGISGMATPALNAVLPKLVTPGELGNESWLFLIKSQMGKCCVKIVGRELIVKNLVI